MTEPSAARRTRTVKESQHETSKIMMPGDANNLGHVFGGVVMAMMDQAAAVAAIRHSRSACVTASIDRVDFREPIHLGDLVVMKASVNYRGPDVDGGWRARGGGGDADRKAPAHEFLLPHVRGRRSRRAPHRSARPEAGVTGRGATIPGGESSGAVVGSRSDEQEAKHTREYRP